uniref:ABC transporter substrate-binding protein n=1 Tax=Caldilinea aerophila TaxID=133453 RepID=A0A7C1FRN1_9CHLR
MQTSKLYRKWMSLLLIVAMLGAGCAAPVAAPAGETTAAQPAAPQGVVTLEFWGGWTGPDANTMQSIVDRYNAEHPNVQVNLSMQAWSPLFDAFIAASSAGSAPDILAMHPQELAQFVHLGLILPLDEIIANSKVIKPENYLENAWEGNKVDGRLYGIPLDLHMHGLYYNKAAFERAGVPVPPPTPPITQDKFMEIAKRLTIDANGKSAAEEGFDANNIVQYAINAHTNHHAFFQWWSLYNQLGGKLISDDGKSCAMDLDKATQAWQFLQDLVYVHKVAPQGQTDYPRDFLDGRTAMLVDGPWRIPQLEQAAAESGFQWGAAQYPNIFGGEFAVWGSGHNFTLPSKADPNKQAAAVAFLEWMAANSAEWAKSGQLPAFKAIMESEEFQQMEGRAPFIASMPYEKLFPATPKYNEIFASNAPTPMMVMAQRIMLEAADPAVEVKTACETISAILAAP